ncbi:MAG TPA: hypothetical protein VFB59_01970 [Candidatus Saccharimonadales bacterium]|nr:hypothetical protein [Candidatus Saccharimonadales bacterium]
MKLLSLKTIVLRYLCATILIALAGLLPNLSGLFIVIPVAIVSLKFLIYDGIVAAIKSKFPTLKTSPWLLVGYGLTVMGDMTFVYSASLDEVDAGFAFLGTFLLTPWILVAALLVMVVATYLSRKK